MASVSPPLPSSAAAEHEVVLADVDKPGLEQVGGAVLHAEGV